MPNWGMCFVGHKGFRWGEMKLQWKCYFEWKPAAVDILPKEARSSFLSVSAIFSFKPFFVVTLHDVWYSLIWCRQEMTLFILKWALPLECNVRAWAHSNIKSRIIPVYQSIVVKRVSANVEGKKLQQCKYKMLRLIMLSKKEPAKLEIRKERRGQCLSKCITPSLYGTLSFALISTPRTLHHCCCSSVPTIQLNALIELTGRGQQLLMTGI